MIFIYSSSALAIKISFFAESDYSGSSVSYDIYDECQSINPKYYDSARTADGDITVYNQASCLGNNKKVSSSCIPLSFPPLSTKRSPPSRDGHITVI